MSSLQPRNSYGRPVRPVTEMAAYRVACARVWCVDILPVLLKYKALQLGRDVRAEWRSLVADTEERVDAWLDRHGF